MNKISYEQRKEVYRDALRLYGANAQVVVAIEELSELQKELCKYLRDGGNIEYIAEETADATIMIEQVREIMEINDKVCQYMDEKVRRLEKRIRTHVNNVERADIGNEAG